MVARSADNRYSIKYVLKSLTRHWAGAGAGTAGAGAGGGDKEPMA